MRLGWRGTLGIALSLILLWVTLRGVNLAEVWGILSASSIPLWIACMLPTTPLSSWFLV